MKTKIQIKSTFGSVLFEYESEDNSLKKAVEEAVKSSADLRYIDLRYANLRYAYLHSADFRSANLNSADLSYANLSYANLNSADLSYADLSYANLSYADLSYANLQKIKHLYQIIPEEGSFIGWKEASGCLVKLEIPAKAKRHNVLGGRKCRASYVKTLQIIDLNGVEIKECKGSHDPDIVYKVGGLTKPDKYDPNPLVECSNGIHFFISKQEALDW